jgi:hypothetical protein
MTEKNIEASPCALSPSAGGFDHCQSLILLPLPSEAVNTFLPSMLKAICDNLR